jgi:hypothetical protein
MSRKRRQRSTKIRKRAEKKQREQAKAQKRQAKLARGDGAVGLLSMDVSADAATTCVTALSELEGRLTSAPIRGWSIEDLQNGYGLSWLTKVLSEAIEGDSDANSLHIEYPEDAKGPVWDQLEALDRAAPGLSVTWDESFDELARAIGESVEVPEEEPEEDEDEDGDEDEDAEGSEDSTQSDA